MRSLIIVISVLLIVYSRAAEPTRMAVVDMSSIIERSRHLSHANDLATKRKLESAREVEERTERYKELLREFQAKQEAIAAETDGVERERKRLDAAEIGQRAKSIERQIHEYRKRRERATQPPEVRARKRVLDDIRTIVREVAEQEGFTLVLDASAKTELQGLEVPFILSIGGAVNITDSILGKHNAATHSVAGLAAEEAPQESGKVTVYYHRTQINRADGNSTNFREIIFREGMTALDAIATGGGMTWMRHAILIRGDEASTIDLTGEADCELKPEDILFLH